MIDALARELAAEIRRSREYETYAAAREKALADEQTAALLRRFHRLQMTVQARRIVIDLHLVKHVDMSFTGEFRRRHLV